jgi:hypothetical protein
MSKSSIAAKIAGSVLIIVGIGLASAFGPASQTISLRGEVPLNCRVSLQGGSGELNGAGVAILGSTNEFCNSGNGYQIFARADGDVEGASIIVDGRAYPLVSGREFPVVVSRTPAVTSRAIGYDAGETDGGGRLTLRIQAN